MSAGRSDRKAVRLTILGKSPAWQDAGGACSAYLLEEGGVRVLLDCGNGAFAKLRQFSDYVDVDAVVISHLHADHYFDLIPYGFALTHAPRQQPVPVPPWPANENPARPKLYGPPGALAAFARLGELIGVERLILDAFEAEEYDPAAPLTIGDLNFTFHLVPHFIDAYAMNVSTATSGRITYGADCRPCDALVEAAQGTDLLIVEATIPRPERTGVRGHMTPAEAGEHAARAGAEQVVLTHISDEIDPGWAVTEAARAFKGPLSVAREGDVFEV